jgi:dTDP-4-amino-4,6-dideoxygalactose transaminase
MIAYAKHLVTEEDIEAVNKVLRSDRLAQGPICAEFEEAMAKQVGTKYAVACSNGTTALQMMYQSVGVTNNTTVYCPAMSYVATANAAKWLGADVVFYGTELRDFAEVDGISPRSPKLVVRMHYGGLKSRVVTNLPMVDDACHTMTHDSQAIASAFSFHPTKFITTGEGGMVVTNDKKMADDCKAIRDNGRVKVEGSPYAQTLMLGSNYRLSEIGAALGLSQLKRLPDIMAKRKAIAKRYSELLADLPQVELPDIVDNQLHLYAIQCDRRDELRTYLANHGIEAQINYIPIYRHPYWAEMGYNPIPSAERWANSCLSLPIHPSISEQDQDQVVRAIHDFYA